MMYWTGTAFTYVKVQQLKGATILMYHSVASSKLADWIEPAVHIEPSAFENQMCFLANYRKVISLGELVAQLKQGENPPPGTVVLTFDDGYLDNMTVAAPILARYSLPATWYLPTGLISRSENPWIDRIYNAFKSRTQTKLSIQSIGSWDLLDLPQQILAYQKLKETLIESGWPERENIIADVIQQLQPSQTPPRLLLTWDEIRKVRQEFPKIEIGVHSTNHIDFTNHPQEIVRAEIQQSIIDFERELGHKPEHFAFPYNRHHAMSRQLVQELGLSSAVVYGDGREVLVNNTSVLFALPRIEPPHSSTLFRLYTGGAFPGLPKALLKRAA
ncbi:polysaccharide deacetylase family protein [Gloeothece verrucosa]|nr:polysaccharide deacetylase family protein [Gloeothece verrucosa]